MQLKAERAFVGYGSHEVLRDISLEIDSSAITVIVGPNGCGKSTLLSSFAGLLVPRAGEVTLDGKPLNRWARKPLARKLAYLPQQPFAPEEIHVRRLVGHGRFAHRRAFAALSSQDHDIIERALSDTGTLEFADRPLSALSGGERQRVWIALALVQTPQILLLDEPTSFLDLGFQFQTLDLLKRLNSESGLGIVMVLHDINQAAWYADTIVAMKAGQILAKGAPEDVVTPENVAELFGIEVARERTAGLGRPYCIPAHL